MYALLVQPTEAQTTSAKGDQVYTLACLVNVYLSYAAGDLLNVIYRDRYVVKNMGEGWFALSSNSVCMAKPV